MWHDGYYDDNGVIGMMMMMMMIKPNFLSDKMVINKGKLQKPQQKKSSYPLLGTHQDTGIGVSCRKKLLG